MAWLEALKLKGAPSLPGPTVAGTLHVRWHFRINEIHEKSVSVLWWDATGFHNVELQEGAILCFDAELDASVK